MPSAIHLTAAGIHSLVYEFKCTFTVLVCLGCDGHAHCQSRLGVLKNEHTKSNIIGRAGLNKLGLGDAKWLAQGDLVQLALRHDDLPNDVLILAKVDHGFHGEIGLTELNFGVVSRMASADRKRKLVMLRSSKDTSPGMYYWLLRFEPSDIAPVVKEHFDKEKETRRPTEIKEEYQKRQVTIAEKQSAEEAKLKATK